MISRREFSRLVAFGGSVLLPQELSAWPAQLAQTPGHPDERFWMSVREQFLMPPNLSVMNAANLCPSPAPVLEAMYRSTKDMDADPSFDNRQKMSTGKENARRLLAEFLRVTPEEIVITRNTSEANNMVSSGLDLKAGDEVVIFADNHPSNNAAWLQKSKRFGYAVTVIAQPNPHPGADYFVDAAKNAMTSRTRVLAFTHQTSTAGDVLPANELCKLARERGALTLVDGASALGFLDVDLSVMKPDFYSGSSHNVAVRAEGSGCPVHQRTRAVVESIRASSRISRCHRRIAHAGSDGTARRARDHRLRRVADLPGEDWPKVIEERSRSLSQALMAGLRRIDASSLDASGSRAVGSRRHVPAGQPGYSQALGGVLPQRSHRLRDADRKRSSRHTLLAAHLQHDGGDRSCRRRDGEGT